MSEQNAEKAHMEMCGVVIIDGQERPGCWREDDPANETERTQRELTDAPVIYGMCLVCRSIEVALNKVIGTRDFSDIGESDAYPIGYGCELCA